MRAAAFTVAAIMLAGACWWLAVIVLAAWDLSVLDPLVPIGAALAGLCLPERTLARAGH